MGEAEKCELQYQLLLETYKHAAIPQFSITFCGSITTNSDINCTINGKQACVIVPLTCSYKEEGNSDNSDKKWEVTVTFRSREKGLYQCSSGITEQTTDHYINKTITGKIT